jgi:RNA polymerase sigma factor (sigma-70 family)
LGAIENRAVAAEIDLATPGLQDLEDRFIGFVSTHRERARRLAWRLVGGNDAAAEDVTQDAFLKAYSGLGRFREDAKLETWFYRILVRQAQSYARWRGVRELWGGLGGEEAAEPGVHDDRDPVLQRRIGDALSRLSRGQRETFVLVHLEGFTVRETAGILAKAEGTVKSHLHRALAALRADLADIANAAGIGTQSDRAERTTVDAGSERPEREEMNR